MNQERVREQIAEVWDAQIIPELMEYIRIPNKSPAFDPKWHEHGHMERAVQHIAGWCARRAIPGLCLEVVRLEGRTPLIFMEIPGATDDTVLIYGHLDKQPEMVGWADGLGPWQPVLRDGRLYGRGGADDGYSAYAALAAVEALQAQAVPHARLVVIIEACEESGSYDLPAYIDALAGRIGEPDLVVCLDSGCGNYDQLWCTTSLRGMVSGALRVRVLTEGVHSGDASGVVPSSFRVLRQLLDRVEDPATGASRLQELLADIPEDRRAQARVAAEILGDTVFSKFPFPAGVRPVNDDLVELVLNRTWRPSLSVTGMDGLPTLVAAGNVLRPETVAKLSFRLAPTTDPERAEAAIRAALLQTPPYGAQVGFETEQSAAGWNAPSFAPWLEQALHAASQQHFGRPAAFMGEGGSIPFMGMLGEKFPQAQFVITGVLGPASNAHGPNEFLHIDAGKRVTACVASILADHATR